MESDTVLESSQNDDFQEVALKRPRVMPPPVKPSREEESKVIAEEDDNEEADEIDEEEEDDGSEGCPICFEAWTTSGFHRLVSLKCGHLFGRRCIERWLSNPTRTKCPQCNAPAKRADIRILYAKRLIAMDTSEKDGLMRQLMEERNFKRMAIEAEAQANVALQAAMADLAKTKAELDSLKKRLMTFDSSAVTDTTPRFDFKRSFKLASQPNACRCLSFDPYYGTFLISKAHYLGNSHGISKVSLMDESTEYIGGIHTDQIRSIAHSPFKDGLILSTGNDSTLCLTTQSSNMVIQSYKLDAPGWSCAFDPSNCNRLYAGIANGSIVEFDLRNTSGPVNVNIPVLPRKLPIHSLHVQGSLLLGGTLDGPFGFEAGETVWNFSSIGAKGSCTSVSFDPLSKDIFASYRLLSQSSVHYKCRLEDKGIGPVTSFNAESVQTIMGGTAIFSFDNTSPCISVVPDEPSSGLHLYSEGRLLAKMETRAGSHILDIKHGITGQHGHVIGALTGTDLYVFTQAPH